MENLKITKRVIFFYSSILQISVVLYSSFASKALFCKDKSGPCSLDQVIFVTSAVPLLLIHVNTSVGISFKITLVLSNFLNIMALGSEKLFAEVNGPER